MKLIIISKLVFLLSASIAVVGQSAGTEQNTAQQSKEQEYKSTKKDSRFSLVWPPTLPSGSSVVTDKSAQFLQKPPNVKLSEGVIIATAAPYNKYSPITIS